MTLDTRLKDRLRRLCFQYLLDAVPALEARFSYGLELKNTRFIRGFLAKRFSKFGRCLVSSMICGGKVARLERFELPTLRFEAWYSIQLSYRRVPRNLAHPGLLVKVLMGLRRKKIGFSFFFDSRRLAFLVFYLPRFYDVPQLPSFRFPV